MSAAWLLTVALLHPVWTQDSPLAELYAQGQLDEVVSLAGERLERDPADQDALYWCGRAELDRARALLASRGQRASRTGLDLALDLADAQLERAAGQLGRVLPADRGPRADARQWHWFARSLRTADDTLAPELERAWSDEGSAYAAYLRGLRELDTDPAAAEAWLRRAGEAAPERADIQLAWAEALARTGKRQAALDAWDRARIARATRAELCSALLGLMPTPDGAATRLERLEQLAADADGASDALLAWHRAHALEQLGRLPEAEAALAAATDGLTPQIIGVRARLLAALNRPLEAQMLL
ncbi:MAG TPA: hypothetical protein VFD43_01910, partial [Planctomycetota bacterium]|nr:hypothetical protein [Planctomycetota bacterium]